MTDLEVYEAALETLQNKLPNLKNGIRLAITHLPYEDAIDIRLKQLADYEKCRDNIVYLQKRITSLKDS